MTLLSHPARANASMPLKNAQKLRQIERQLFFCLLAALHQEAKQDSAANKFLSNMKNPI